MSKFVLLDSGPLGLAVCRRGTKQADELRAWLAELEIAGVFVLIPAVMDYEVRRELIRAGATGKLRNLEDLQKRFRILPITPAAWLRAAEFWALTRRMGMPTGPDTDLDADATLAGCAATVGRPGDEVVVASSNVRHLSRFPGIDAREWTSIGP
jgi:predicted nucleic acid-binding protein